MADETRLREMSFARGYQELASIFRFVDDFFDAESIDRKHRAVIYLAVEELFTNMVKYHSNNDQKIVVALRHAGRELSVSLTDFDVDRFDPTSRPDVDVSLPLDARRPGGLGIHLIKVLTDRVEYEYVDRRSTTTFFKTLE